MGAMVMPLFIWFISRWIMKKIGILQRGYQASKEIVRQTVNLRYRVLFGVIFAMVFLFMELMWRMMFEFLIAYMQIWEVLVNQNH
jgi:hypothetical protein